MHNLLSLPPPARRKFVVLQGSLQHRLAPYHGHAVGRVPTSLEPNCSKVAGAHPVTTAGARADILTVLQDLLLLSDAFVNPRCVDTCIERAATTADPAAEVSAQKKVRNYALHGLSGHDFTPLVVESYGHQCKASHVMLNQPGHLAADSGRVTKGACIEGTLHRLGVLETERCAVQGELFCVPRQPPFLLQRNRQAPRVRGRCAPRS